MADLKDKVVLITGSSAGIGEGIALHFAKLGSKLTLMGRNKENLQKVVEKCKSFGLDDTQIVSVVGDMKSSEIRETLIKETVDKFGRLDVLVNNAAISLMDTAGFTPEHEYDEIMNVNLKAVYFLTQLAIPHLKETKGNIINFSSIVATAMYPNLCVYSMSKSAIETFTKCLALELAPTGVRVNAVSPGPIHSMIFRRGNAPFSEEQAYNEAMEKVREIVPIRRIGYPKDVAKGVAFLASEEQASFITGSVMTIDGAMNLLTPSVVQEM